MKHFRISHVPLNARSQTIDWHGLVIMAGVVTLLFATPSTMLASSISKSAGILDVGTDTDFFLRAGATGDICASTTLAGPFVGNAGVPVGCLNTVVGGPLAGVYAGLGYLGVAKFPSPVTRNGTKTGTGGVAPNTTLSTASASWTSGGTNFLTRHADFTTSANVVRTTALSPADTATAEANDPWIFTPAQMTRLTINVSLDVLELMANADAGERAAASIESFGAFGLGTAPSTRVCDSSNPQPPCRLVGWSFSEAVVANNSIAPFSIELLSESLTLVSGQTYWLTADLNTAAFGAPIPEPATVALLACGLGVLVTRSSRRNSTRRRA